MAVYKLLKDSNLIHLAYSVNELSGIVTNII